MDYQAYGNVARERVRVVNSPLRFQGQYFDEETGLHYNRHRYYSPQTGRFITVDPIGLAGGLNNYQYVKNPTGWVDPLGLEQLPGDCPAKEALRREQLNAKWGSLTSSERSALLQEKAEANAYRRLKELEDSNPGAHFLEKHGAQTSLESQLERVQYGINPTTKIAETRPDGKVKLPSSATRFLSHRDQLNAIQRAQHIYATTGSKVLAEAPITFKHIVGEGYKKGSLDYGVSYSAQVWFSRDNKLVTAFPIHGQ